MQVFDTCLIPAAAVVLALYLFRWRKRGAFHSPLHAFGEPAHHIRQLAVRFLSPTAQSFGGFGAFPSEHGAEAQKFKERLLDDPDGPQPYIVTMLIDFARLLNFHQSGLPEVAYNPFTTALTHAGLVHQGFHADIHKAVVQGGRPKTHGSQIQMIEYNVQGALIGFTPLGARLALAFL